MVKLSKRLMAAAEMVTPGNRLADVGTDHGYVPIWLVSQHRIPEALAMDIGAGPLERAREHIKELGLEAYIQVRLSDGVKELAAGEADTVLIAGMGGGLIVKILMEGETVLSTIHELVLGPQSEAGKVREYLCSHPDYSIDREEFLCEAGKYYPLIHVTRTGNEDGKKADCRKETPYTEAELLYGRYPLQQRNPVLLEFLQKQQVQYAGILKQLKIETTDSAKERVQELEKELELIKTAMEAFAEL